MRMTENIRREETGNGQGGHFQFVAVLLAILTLLLITAGLAGAWFFKQMDDQYTMLVVRTVTNLNAVQDIVLHASIGYANVLELSLVDDPQKQAELLQTTAAERATNDQLFDNLRRTVTDPLIRSSLEDVIARRQISRKATDDFIASCQKRDPAETEAALSRQLLVAFEEYQKSCDKLGSLIQANSLQTGTQVSAKIRSLRLLFFSLAVLPLALAFFLLVLTLWLFWGMPMEVDLRDANSHGYFTPRTRPHLAVGKPDSELAAPRGTRKDMNSRLEGCHLTN
jgi:hypothetical protein